MLRITYNPLEHVNTSTTTSFEIDDNEDMKLGMYKVFEIYIISNI